MNYTVDKMVQYGVWPNCNNNCKFCLKTDKTFLSSKEQINILNAIKENILYVDWKNEFSGGISLLGGELYNITDQTIQAVFLELIDTIIEKVLKVSKNPICRFSTVSNGIYDPSFLYAVIDLIKSKVGMNKVDMNFSYDFKYRYKSEQDKKLVLANINEFHTKYQYRVGVQMILTQNLINLWKWKKFDVSKFIEDEIPGNNFCLLYPHKVMTGEHLDDFFFVRKDFLEFLQYLRHNCAAVYKSFMQSTRNSATFKYSGLYHRKPIDVKQQPILAEDKADICLKCGHSNMYKCYADTDKCMLCDMINTDFDGLL